jgi:hypothetical protein
MLSGAPAGGGKDQDIKDHLCFYDESVDLKVEG